MEGSGITEVRESLADGTLTHAESVLQPENVILLCTVGSSAHGLALEGTDDRDEMGIVIEPPEYVIGLKTFEQKITRTKPEGVRSEHGDLDQTIYSARKFCRLALSGNPSILTLLFAPITTCLAAGTELRENAHWFAARKAGNAFLGYATQQRQRLVGERGQMNVKRPELVEKYGYDTKYAMHMIRLGLQGREFLQTGRLSLPMKEDERNFLMKVRRGEIELNDLLTFAGELECEVADLIETSPLPKEPNREAATNWLVHTYTRHWGYHHGTIQWDDG
jgi:predicted nucleotidyltransferase